MKHTPGPWKCRRTFGGSLDLFGEDGARVILSNFFLINQEPNSRLIAAAPELLEALQACRDALVRIREAGGHSTSAEILAERAIAKATKGTP